MKHFLLLLALMVGHLLMAQENNSPLPDISQFEAHRYIEGNDTLPYRLYSSQKADTMTEALPLVIFLHGAGERGNDNYMQLKHCIKYFLDDTVTICHEQSLEVVDLHLQLLAAVGLTHVDAVVLEVLELDMRMHIDTFEDGLFARLEMFVFDELEAVAVEDECIA